MGQPEPAEQADPTLIAIRKVRHDLSNPLAALLAETQLLLLDPGRHNAETLEGLKQIESLARRMREILHDISV
jgi:signal transduction histidine kinase